MRSGEASALLVSWGIKQGCCALTKGDLSRLLGEPRSRRAIERTVANLVRDGVLERAARDVYVIPAVASLASVYPLDQIARVAARPHVAIESLESAASAWGIVSQRYARGATYVTTGRPRVLSCSFGHVVLVHTELPLDRLMRESVERGAGRSRMSNRELTLRLLKRTGRARAQNLEVEDA